jgi:hypothetical protein
MGPHETFSASVVLLGAKVNAAIYHFGPDGMMEAEMPRRRSLENESTDAQRKGMNDV